MNREQIRSIAAQAVGNPDSGAVAEALDVIAEAIDEALNPATPHETRVVQPTETRGQ
jgi:hypothetical protein